MIQHTRRRFLAGSVLSASALVASSAIAAQSSTSAATKPATTKAKLPDDLVWHDVRDIGLEGRAFDDTESYFDRLPKRAKDVVRPEIWTLQHNTAGMSVRFKAKTTAIYLRYELTGANLAMPHMPATGMSGVDLYAKHDGRWHWLATVSPKDKVVEAALAANVADGVNEFQINLPLYNGVKSMEIGVPKDATFEPIAPRKDKPILFYGTSITQGGVASRPGMAFVAILGRRLHRPMLNFGFSGNGRTEVEVAQYLAEIDASVFVLDCMANMGMLPVTERTEAVVKLLREKRPEMPILLVETHVWGSGDLTPNHDALRAKKSAELRKAYDNLISAGVKNLYYRTGEDLIGTDGEGTVDGSHPNDLGMMRYADALEPDLRKLLESKASGASIRLARESDLGAVTAIYNHYVRTSVCTYQETEDTIDDRAKWLQHHTPDYFPATVAVIDDEVVGFGALSPFRARSAYRFTVENAVYVRHDFHRRGIGRLLLADLIERSRAIGHKTIVAVIDAEQAGSVTLHREFGFEVCGEMKRVGFKFGRWLDVILMQLVI